MITLDFWVVGTDYDQYAVVYGCTLRNQSGTCKEAHAWVFSRYRSINNQSVKNLINNLVNSVCLNISTFTTTQQILGKLPNDCTLTGIF